MEPNAKMPNPAQTRAKPAYDPHAARRKETYQYKELNTSVGCFSDDRCPRSITEAQRFFGRAAHVRHSGLVALDSLIGCGYLR